MGTCYGVDLMKTYHFPWNQMLPKGKRNRHRRQIYLEVLNRLGESHKELLQGTKCCVLSEEEVEFLVEQIITGSPIHSGFHKLNFL